MKGKVNSDCQQLHLSQMKNHLSPQHFLKEVFGSKKFQSNIHNLMWGNILLKRSICEELCSTSVSYYDNKMHTLFHLMFKKKWPQDRVYTCSAILLTCICSNIWPMVFNEIFGPEIY